MKILILFALPSEFAELKNRYKNLSYNKHNHIKYTYIKNDLDDLYFALTGLGTNNASVVSTSLINLLSPDIIMMCGTSGGLLAGQQVGDIILGERVVDIDLYGIHEILINTPFKESLMDPHSLKKLPVEFIINHQLNQKILQLNIPNLSLGTIVSSNSFPTPKEKFTLIKQLGCSVIEMESVGVLNAASRENIDVMLLRTVSNNIDSKGNDLGTPKNSLQICSVFLAEAIMLVLKEITRSNNI